jgi:hypothetical protein
VSGTAVQFRRFAAGEDPLTPTAGVGNLALLIPEAEPLSQGELPVRPDLVRRVVAAIPVRRVAVRSGQVVTAPRATSGRARFSLAYRTLGDEEYVSLRGFLSETLVWNRFAFDLDVDAAGVLTRLRLTAVPELMYVGRRVFGVVELEAEEIF